ncbi:hypothetical protein ACPUVO_18905 [Pseudocolwellia sp. HL-MZ19]|uniref:hypothetical protein n=1 Tax=Pseudocolwellia sp. HL-MZ19 TaxID=3400846 RepID=UPI003CF237FD
MYDSSILVLLYNCEIWNSKTLNALKISNTSFYNCKLVIWNNGPHYFSKIGIKEFESLGFDVEIIQTMENKALSHIYNKFINDNTAQRFIILDDDSSIDDTYLNETLTINENQIGVPRIYSNSEQTGPLLNGKIYNTKLPLLNSDKFVAIGSGVVIGKLITDELKKKYKEVFDSRYYLYGVDTTFFLRVTYCQLNTSIELMKGFKHSLSRLEDESVETKHFRKLERTYDLGMTLKNYYPIYKTIYFVIKYTKIYLGHRLTKQDTKLYYKYFIKALWTGKHYRN